MDYYNKLIETRTNRILDKEIYYERHHILPSSLGGDNSDNNLIYLTAREHFLAHWLLWRIYRNREMSVAFWCMTTYKNKKTQGTYRNFSSRAFQEARESKVLTSVSDETRYKNGNAMRGKTHSEETKNKIGELKRGKPLSEQNKLNLSKSIKNKTYEELMGIEEANNKKQKMSDSLKGRIFSEEHRKNLSKSQKGKKLSEQSKLKLSLSMKGRKHPHKGTSGELTCNITNECPHCGKIGRSITMFRWHFEKCKFKK